MTVLPASTPLRSHHHRHIAVAGAAVAQLAVGTATPGGQGAVRAQRQAVVAAGGDGDDRLAGEHSGLVHQHRHTAVGGAVVAQLAVALYPQAARVPSAHKRQAVVRNPRPVAMIVLPASTPVMSTGTGTLLLVVLPLPNWP